MHLNLNPQIEAGRRGLPFAVGASVQAISGCFYLLISCVCTISTHIPSHSPIRWVTTMSGGSFGLPGPPASNIQHPTFSISTANWQLATGHSPPIPPWKWSGGLSQDPGSGLTPAERNQNFRCQCQSLAEPKKSNYFDKNDRLMSFCGYWEPIYVPPRSGGRELKQGWNKKNT